MRIPGIDIVDLKEPRHGALAPAPEELWQSAVRYSEEGLAKNPSSTLQLSSPQLSAALGEFSQAQACVGQLPAGFQFAKMGPHKTTSEQQLQRRWETIREALPNCVDLVAVAYADFKAAQTLSPLSILTLAARMGFQRILLDTFTKNGKSSLDHLSHQGLVDFSEAAKEHGLWWALAGSIQIEHLDELCVMPDCLGLRGSVCTSDRMSEFSPQRCQEWVERLKLSSAGLSNRS